ncbi:MAG: glycosyltransferase [Anaerolineaceae bacterium]
MHKLIGLPKLTVIMTVYNAERFVGQAIQSVLDQTFSDFEFIIVEDGSTDDSLKVIKQFSDPRIHLIENGQNLDIVESSNKALSLSRANLIARIDADDICFPERFEKQMDYLEKHPQVGLLGSAVQRINGEGMKCGKTRLPYVESFLLKFWLNFENVINHPTIIFDKRILSQTGFYDPTALYVEDYDMCIRLSQLTEIANLPEPLVYKREHQGNVSLVHRDIQQSNHIKVMEREINKLTGMNYPSVYFEELYAKTSLSFDFSRKLIALYDSAVRIFATQRKLTDSQIRQLQYTVSWRINSILKRTVNHPGKILEKLRVYFINHDILVNDLRHWTKQKKK